MIGFYTHTQEASDSTVDDSWFYITDLFCPAILSTYGVVWWIWISLIWIRISSSDWSDGSRNPKLDLRSLGIVDRSLFGRSHSVDRTKDAQQDAPSNGG